LANKKKSDMAADETERPDDDLETGPASAAADERSKPDIEDESPSAEDDLGDADIREEVVADAEAVEAEAEAEWSSGRDADAPEDESPGLADSVTDKADWPEDATGEIVETEFAEQEFPDPDQVTEQELADLQRLDGADAAPAEPEEVVGPAETEPAPETDSTEIPGEPEADLPKADLGATPEVHTIEKETVVVEKKSGGVLSGFLGGLVAATGLAFAAPYVIPANMLPSFPNEELESQLSDQSDAVATLQGTVADLSAQLAAKAGAEDLSALQSSLASTAAEISEAQQTMATSASLDEVSASLGEFRDGLEPQVAAATAKLADLSAMTDGMAQRVNELEKRPIAEANDPRAIAAVQAYGREVEGFKGQLTELQAAVKAQMDQAQALVTTTTAAADEAVRKALDDSEEKIAAAEAAADAAAEQAAAEAAAAAHKALRAERAQAVVDIQSALDSGEGFDNILALLDGVEVPAALTTVAADGVATQVDLQDAYTLAARNALAAARKETAGDDMSGKVSSFVQTQLGLRSLAPADGDDPDAVLSRAEAAARSGALTDAVTELSALPEGGQSAMADWVAQATARAQALAAADELAASLATN
jgi:hypothetical protein